MNRLFYFILFFIVLGSNLCANSLDKKLTEYHKSKNQPIKIEVEVKTPPIT